jgi:hypothetical protein
MNQKNTYILLCALGAVLPLSQFIPWVGEHGLNLALFFQELFSNRIGAFFGLDVIMSAIVLFTFIFHEGRRLQINNLWLPVIATLSVGVSLGFPLFLYMRQLKIET